MSTRFRYVVEFVLISVVCWCALASSSDDEPAPSEPSPVGDQGEYVPTSGTTVPEGNGQGSGSGGGTATTLSGRVVDGLTGLGLPNALVATDPPSASMSTNGEGMFVIQTNLLVGRTYRVSAKKPEYSPNYADVTVNEGANQIADVQLFPGTEHGDCFPLCRADFACIGGACVSACNPPCALSEVCNNGTCVDDCEVKCGGRECGPDPQCGQSCGSCASVEVCSGSGTCDCAFSSCGSSCCDFDQVCAGGKCCTPDCDGRECGLDPVCGQPCGSCSDGYKCQGSTCVEGPCVPECAGRECGPDPSCGQSCGSCGADETCTSGGQCDCVYKACGSDCCSQGETCAGGSCCLPDCAGKDCGSDGCGGSCGTCSYDASCTGSGVCTCDHAACGGACCKSGETCFGGSCCKGDCDYAECGSDGCGGSCGSCPSKTTCVSGQCECAYATCGGDCCASGQVCNGSQCCTPDCGGKACGDDGCGGSCGSCGWDEVCVGSGKCEDAMVTVPSGSFWMGCNESVDSGCLSDEYPYHKVTLSTYEIDRVEVSEMAYGGCVDAGKCAPPDYKSFGKSPLLPAVQIDWYSASDYCDWAGKRLCTEAEWEKAARGTSGQTFPWGNSNPSCSVAVMDKCGDDWLQPVGSKAGGASPYGALNMSDNAKEWVADWYKDTAYESSSSNNPTGPSSGSTRVLRGGDYTGVVQWMRSSYRSDVKPTAVGLHTGFRCCRWP